MKDNRDHSFEWEHQRLFEVLWWDSDLRWINFHGQCEKSDGDWTLDTTDDNKIIGDNEDDKSNI